MSQSSKIEWDDFQRVDLRAGTIVSAEPFAQARKPAYKIVVDFGPEIGLKKTSAQVTEHYRVEELTGKKVIGVTNFPPKQIGPFMSEFLLVGFHREDQSVILAVPDQEVPDGTKLA